jgi:hypothetical protein
MMTIKGGEFWIAEILYTNGTDAKKRPVLVLWVDGQDVVVAVVTSAQIGTLYYERLLSSPDALHTETKQTSQSPQPSIKSKIVSLSV